MIQVKQRLHRIFPERDPICPKCKMQIGTFFHMFWECPIIVTFWSAIFGEINSRLEVSLRLYPC